MSESKPQCIKTFPERHLSIPQCNRIQANHHSTSWLSQEIWGLWTLSLSLVWHSQEQSSNSPLSFLPRLSYPLTISFRIQVSLVQQRALQFFFNMLQLHQAGLYQTPFLVSFSTNVSLHLSQKSNWYLSCDHTWLQITLHNWRKTTQQTLFRGSG